MIKELWYLPRPARNHYPGGFPLHFEKRLFEMYKPKSILQPFGGGALYGTRCDINPESNPAMLTLCLLRIIALTLFYVTRLIAQTCRVGYIILGLSRKRCIKLKPLGCVRSVAM